MQAGRSSHFQQRLLLTEALNTSGPSRYSSLNARVVMVDDDDAPDILAMLNLMVSMRGCRVLKAENGWQAVELTLSARPDLILMDLSMPVMDGYKATRRILAGGGMGRTPVVAVSASCGDPQHRDKALEAGCVECIAKPVNLRVIDRLLETHLRKH